VNSIANPLHTVAIVDQCNWDRRTDGHSTVSHTFLYPHITMRAVSITRTNEKHLPYDTYQIGSYVNNIF